MERYSKFLDDQNSTNKSLFVNTKVKTIKHDFATSYLNVIKKKHFLSNSYESLDKNPFTPTGLAKFAIIRMILNNANHSVISDLTGYMTDVLSDCQNKVNELKELKRNRYINHMIRDIQTFDEL